VLWQGDPKTQGSQGREIMTHKEDGRMKEELGRVLKK
jgi:hypothetical protein